MELMEKKVTPNLNTKAKLINQTNPITILKIPFNYGTQFSILLQK